MIHIDFLYFEDCPSHDVALERLQSVLAEEGVEAEIDITRVETDEQAQATQFVGSPTIRINGMDIQPPDPDAYFALSCRMYKWDDGRISPLPSPDMIRRIVRKAAAN